MMISLLLIHEMIISNIDKKRKLGFLLSIFTRALFFRLNVKKTTSRVILNDIISLKSQKNIYAIEDEGVFCTEKNRF